jgi:hypothetical protein
MALTASALHHLAEDPAEGLATTARARMSANWAGELLDDERARLALHWCVSTARLWELDAFDAPALLRAAALVAERYERQP